MNIIFDDKTEQIIQSVSSIFGQSLYLVGGCVRDLLLGKDPKDYDFTTPLLPNDIEELVRRAGLKPHISGKRFGTIGCNIQGHHVEITTFRTEMYDGRSRKPLVEFVQDITADLSRRDFTINAMAIRVDNLHIIDPFDGGKDLENKIIRAVNNPGERFREDPLRMLRATRFASQYDFSIEEDTYNAVRNHAQEILRISKERWVRELDLLLTSKTPSIGLQHLAKTRLLNFMLPEISIQVGYDQDSPYHELDLWAHTLKTVDAVPNTLENRWAGLLHDVGKPFTALENTRGYHNYPEHDAVGAELTWKIGKYLRWGNQRLDTVLELVKNHLRDDDSPIAPADSAARYE